jgi:tetratricopeptide (TPR) repeat protein
MEKMGRKDEAISFYEQAIESGLTRDSIYYHLACILEEREDFQRAIDLFKQ